MTSIRIEGLAGAIVTSAAMLDDGVTQVPIIPRLASGDLTKTPPTERWRETVQVPEEPAAFHIWTIGLDANTFEILWTAIEDGGLTDQLPPREEVCLCHLGVVCSELCARLQA